MKAVLLCAGKSTRTYPLTLTRPKPLLKVANKTILQHAIEQLSQLPIEELIIITGYKKEMIEEHAEKLRQKLGLSFGITFIEQKEQMGTGHALLQAKQKLASTDKIADKFMVINGDDFYFADDLKRLAKEKNAVLTAKAENPAQFGIIISQEGKEESKEKKILKKIIEKPKEFIGDSANTGCFVLTPQIFGYEKEIKKTERNEIELVDFVTKLAEKTEVACIEAKNWIPISYSWSLLEANKSLLSKIKTKINEKAVIENNVSIKGEVIVGKNSVIKSGAYIEGPAAIGENCSVGPNCHIRPFTSIGNNCRIGAGVEIKNTIIMDNSAVPHLSYIGDSVIGENVNIGAGTITANVRHDKDIIKTMLNRNLINTGMHKFGAIIGDNASLGIKTIIYPGRKIWPGKTTLPGEIVQKDIE